MSDDIVHRIAAILTQVEPAACFQDPGESQSFSECRYCEGRSPAEAASYPYGEQELHVRHAVDCPVVGARALLQELEGMDTVNPPDTRIYRDRAGRCARHQADVCEVCPGETLLAILEPLASIGGRLLTQDGRATADPVYLVQSRRRIYGVADDHAELFAWFGPDEEPVAEDLAQSLSAGREAGCPAVAGYRRTGYIDVWEDVATFLTLRAAEDLIARRGYDYKEPRVYVASGHMNSEWKLVRAGLGALAEHLLPGMKTAAVEEEE